MKVIFTKDIPPQVKKGQVKNVPRGYARNYLLPRKLAMPFTLEEEQKMILRQKKQKEMGKLEKTKQENLLSQLNKRRFIFEVKANEDGTLYSGLGKREIVEKIEKEFKIKLEEKTILLDQPLKFLGQHPVRFSHTSAKEGILIIEIRKTKKY